MRILMLSAASSVHTIKWVRALSEQGIEVALFSLVPADSSTYQSMKGVRIHDLTGVADKRRSPLSKLGYLMALPELKKLIKKFKPDILHAHYATSYGLLGALAGFHPFVVSVWGSDVYDFPRISPIHAALLRFNLSRADKVLSTSQAMASETKRYTEKSIEVTPFGIDTEVFSPKEEKGAAPGGPLIVGTFKSLEPKYGIDNLIRAFKRLVERSPSIPLSLMIVGGGSLRGDLQALAEELGVLDRTVFTGKVPHSEIPAYNNSISVAVFLSNSESFGVAVVEAQACGKPVVVSNVGGLPEVVENGVTGFVVPPGNPEAAATAIEKLMLDEGLRIRMGKAGRERAVRLYNWKDNVRQMILIYQSLLPVPDQE